MISTSMGLPSDGTTPNTFQNTAMSGGSNWGGSQYQMPGMPFKAPTLGSTTVPPPAPTPNNYQSSGMLYGQIGSNGQPDFNPAHTVANTMWQGAPNQQIANNVANASGSTVMGAYLPGENTFLQSMMSSPQGSWANPQWRAATDAKVMATDQSNPAWQQIYGGYQPQTLGGSNSGIPNPNYKGPANTPALAPQGGGGAPSGYNVGGSVPTNAPIPTTGYFGQPITNPAVQGGLSSAQQSLISTQQMLQLLQSIQRMGQMQSLGGSYGAPSGYYGSGSNFANDDALAFMLGMIPQQGKTSNALGNGGMGWYGAGGGYPSMP